MLIYEIHRVFLVTILYRFGSLMACETFHADVHAGNLWLLRDGRIGFLDFGRYSVMFSHAASFCSFDAI